MQVRFDVLRFTLGALLDYVAVEVSSTDAPGHRMYEVSQFPRQRFPIGLAVRNLGIDGFVAVAQDLANTLLNFGALFSQDC